MHGYHELKDEAALEALECRMGGFHDALMKEMHVAERAWVDQNASKFLSFRMDLRLVVQSQWHLRAVELLAIGVGSLRLGAPQGTQVSGHLTMTRVAAPVQRTIFRFVLDDVCDLECERLFVAERPEWHGPQARLDGEVPSPDAVPARDLGDGCRQCSACATPFEAGGRAWAWCPGCRRLTICATVP
jgi:hypothetical protein